MSSDVDNSGNDPGAGNGQTKALGSRVCPSCKTPLTADNAGGFCPVCMLRTGLSGTEEFGREGMTSEPDCPDYKYVHYELVRREDGTPVELGRGAMGVTYKAVDINLQRPVALKVINNRHLENESVRQRFVREARAAASLRHPNVASVFHLGKTGEDYFYAMEFVEGEPLDRVLKFRGPLDVDLALEIVDQVAAALSAAYRQNLVHRDIKPSNLMVVFGEGRRVTVKVIDFGLAKPIRAPLSGGGLSEAGMFIGTPHFSSPEQCSGCEADIRSDLYSLSVTLWVMLTGKVPFDGMATEVMHKHLHEAPPLERLEHVPKPVVSLIESLLEKDPAKRPQSPYQLQTMIREVRETLGADRQIDLVRNQKGVKLGQARPWPRTWSLVMMVGIVVGITMICFYFILQKTPPSIYAKSVAVLPFDNVGDDKQNEYLSDGLTTEVIFQLSKISDLRVIARSSVLRYKAVPNASRKTLPEIGKELGVATILESTVQRIDNHLKVVAILYNAVTNQRLWGQSYDRETKDVFAIQSDVAENIAAALQVRLSDDQIESIQQRPTENLTAYDLYLRGQALYELLHEKDNEKAITLFRQALEADPKFALGYVGLANAYIERANRFEAGNFWLDSAIDLCRKAIDLDPTQVRGYVVLARALTSKFLRKEAEEPIRKALELAPNDEYANIQASKQFIDTDRFVDWYAAVRKCHALNPNRTYGPYTLATICAIVGDNVLMEKWMQRAITLEDDPARRRMLECERNIFRREYGKALAGFEQLPSDLMTVGPRAVEQLVGCAQRLGDWLKVLRLTKAQIEKGGEDRWAFFNLALALRALGREAEARQKMERVVALAREGLAINEQDVYAREFLAFASRFLDRKEEAYEHLRMIFPGILEDAPLLRDDYIWDMFMPDAEFQNMIIDFDKKNQINRARIREIEKSS